jgi:hypothetical protein
LNLDKLIYPITIKENIEFRQRLHDWLSKDESAQRDYINLLKINPVIAYDTLFWTYNPNKPIGEMNQPFIVSARPKQVEAIGILKQGLEGRKDIGINKSREEGATELLMKWATLLILFYKDISILMGSRSEELVDKTGDSSTLFAKIDYALEHLPKWLHKRLHIERNFKHLKNLDLNSSVDGEATNENFGAGKRTTLLILDEFGRVAPKLAESIRGTVNPISNNIIFNSTHWFGPEHAFNKVLERDDILKIDLMWYDNPEKTVGVYYDYDSKEWPIPIRSAWFDREVRRAAGRRDVMMNLWGDPTGASDMFFDYAVLKTIRDKFVKVPYYEGDIEWKPEKKVPGTGKFVKSKTIRFKWWGILKDEKGLLRPNQMHNYIIGCDISFGTGASNSTAEIIDRNTGELIGEYVCSDKSPEEFADQVCALGKWIGGNIQPFLIWERTGGQGINFGRRVIENGWTNVYSDTTEQTKTRVRKKIYGWNNTGGADGTKQDVLTRLSIALKEGTVENPERKFVKVYSEDAVKELAGFTFYESGDIDASERADESSGARKRHGDRVIGLALACLGLLDQPKAERVLENNPPYGSLAYRMRQTEMEQKKSSWDEPESIFFRTNWQ